MNLLLDTHIILWWLENNKLLSAKSRKVISSPNNLAFISAATAWEIAIKKVIGKLSTPDDFQEALRINGFQTLAITLDHAETAGALPRYHDDPFDRMLIAQAQLENLTVITHDKHFKKYEINLMLN